MTLARRVHAVIGDILGIVGECCADPERLPHAVAAFAEEMDPSVGSLRTIQQMLERDTMMSEDLSRPCHRRLCGIAATDVACGAKRGEPCRAEAEAHVAGPKDGLAEAVAGLRAYDPAHPWTYDDVHLMRHEPDSIKNYVATILNAVLSGQLVPATPPAEEQNCPDCDLPHPSRNPYCFCATPPANDAARDERTMTVEVWRDERRWQAALAALPMVADANPNLPDDPAGTWPDTAVLAERRAKWALLQADALLAAMGGSNG